MQNCGRNDRDLEIERLNLRDSQWCEKWKSALDLRGNEQERRLAAEAQLAELREIAGEFLGIAIQVKTKGMKSCAQAIEGSLLSPDQHSAICKVEHAIARYTAWLERNNV